MPPTPSTPRRIADPADPDFTPSDLRIPELRSLLATRNIRLPTSARKPALVQAVQEAFGASNPAVPGKDDEEEDKEEAGNFSDQNVFQAGSGNELSPKLKGGPLLSRKSAGDALPSKRLTKTKEDVAAARRKTVGSSNSPNSFVRRIPSSSSTPPSLPPSRSVSTFFQNYMDPIVAKATPPRQLVDGGNDASTKTKKAVKRALSSNAEDVDIGAEADVSAQADSGDFMDTEEEEDDQVERETPSKGRGHRRSTASDRRTNAAALGGKSSIIPLLRLIAGAALLAWWVLYVRDSKAIGYCDTGSDTNTLLETRNADYLRRKRSRAQGIGDEDHDSVSFIDLVPSALMAKCTPCPPHARCAEGSLTACLSDEYVYHSSMLSHVPIFRHVLPLNWLADRCRTDSRRMEMIDDLAGEIARQLGSWRGAVTCGGRPRPQALALLSVMSKRSDSSLPQGETEDLRFLVPEDELFKALQDLRDEEIVPSEQYFSHLWDSAIEELLTEGLVKRLIVTPSRGEVVTASQESHEAEVLLLPGQDSAVVLIPSSSLASIPLGCRVRLALRSLLRATILYILGSLSLLLALLYIRTRLRRSRFESHKIDEVSTEVLQRLAEQQLMSLHSDSQPPHLPANHLRDLMLPAARGVSPVVRKSIWSGVSRQVESNSNVRVGMKKWKGEYSRCWEWVGVVTPGYRGGLGGASGASSPASERVTPVDEVQIEQGREEEGEGVAMGEVMQSKGSRRVSYEVN